MTTTPPPGTLVRFYEKDGGWRFGTIATVNGNQVRVNVAGGIKRLRPDALEPWPPERPATSDDTTPPARAARRKR